MQLITVTIDKPEEINFILGQSHFIKTVEDVHEALVAAVHVGPRRILDPACGAGVFLLAAFRRAWQRRVENGQGPREAARAALTHEVTGLDCDPQAVALAEFSLRLAAWELAGLDSDFALNLRLADALGPLPKDEGRYEVVLGRPPHLDARHLPPARRAWLRACYPERAASRFGLLCAFIERALSLLREGGVLSFLLPESMARNGHAASLRELLCPHLVEAFTPPPPSAAGGLNPRRTVFKALAEPRAVILRVRKAKSSKS
jgi:SAM-dependent methyltransferase